MCSELQAAAMFDDEEMVAALLETPEIKRLIEIGALRIDQ